MVNRATSIHSSLLFIAFGSIVLALSHCGLSGGSSSLNDVRPSGTPQYQGNFTSENGQTVSGTALVFYSGDTSYIVRLENLSAPSQSNLVLKFYINGATQTAALRGSSGNQNYTLTATAGSTFSQVDLYSTSNNNTVYGTATLLIVH